VAWEGERDRLLAEVRTREEAAERMQAAVGELRRRWARRRKEELEQLRGQRAANEKLNQEWRALREAWWQRITVLEEQRRALAEKELALERHRQEYLTGTEDAAAAERGVERLRRRWIRQNAAIVRSTTEGRRQLQAEAAQLHAHYALFRQQTEALTQREANLAERQAALEHRETLAKSHEIRMQAELAQMQAQRDRYEKQSGELREEVERIALLLLQESSDMMPRNMQAA
jgi:hypothetical protein